MFSKSENFIYIEIWKSGSRSIVAALKKYEYKLERHKKIVNKFSNLIINDNIFTIPKKHATANDYLNYFGKEKYSEFFSFTFSRNPFSQQVSYFHYMKEQKNHFQHEIIKDMTFDEYIRWRCKNDVQLQKQFVVDGTGKNIVNFIGKLENIESDLKDVAKSLNIEYTLEHLNKTNHRDYREYYSSYSEELIREHYRDDFEFFKYSKNIAE